MDNRKEKKQINISNIMLTYNIWTSQLPFWVMHLSPLFSETGHNHTAKWLSVWKVNEINKKLKFVFKRIFSPLSLIQKLQNLTQSLVFNPTFYCSYWHRSLFPNRASTTCLKRIVFLKSKVSWMTPRLRGYNAWL